MRITSNTQSALVFIFSFLWHPAFASDINTGPSFDCNKASTKVEKAICADLLLSGSDRQLSKLYQAKKAIPALEEKLKTSQIEWLRTEREKCENPEKVEGENMDVTRTACLKDAYKNRIETIHLLKAAPENAVGKPPVKFKLMTGSQYSLCRDYVDMLNQSAYIDAPICERKILSGFSKFRAVKWKEITNKKEIWRVKSEQIKLGDQSEKDKEWSLGYYQRLYESKGYPRLQKTRMDIDHDARVDTVYRFTSLTPDREKHGNCSESAGYFIKYDEPGKTETIHSGSPNRASYGAHLSSIEKVDVFFYNGRAFQDYWNGWNADYQIKVNETSGIPSQVCGINIIQQKGENNDRR